MSPEGKGFAWAAAICARAAPRIITVPAFHQRRRFKLHLRVEVAQAFLLVLIGARRFCKFGAVIAPRRRGSSVSQAARCAGAPLPTSVWRSPAKTGDTFRLQRQTRHPRFPP